MMKTGLLAATLCAVLATAASAQGFPSRPIRIVVPYPAGGTTDAMARVLQEPLQKPPRRSLRRWHRARRA